MGESIQGSGECKSSLLRPTRRFTDQDEALVDELDEVVDPDPEVGLLEILGEFVGRRPDDGQPLAPDLADEFGLGLGELLGDTLDELGLLAVLDAVPLLVPVMLPGVLRDRAEALDVLGPTEGPDRHRALNVFPFEGEVVVGPDGHLPPR